MAADEEAASPKLSKQQISLILSSPIHRRIKHAVYSIVAIASFGCLLSLTIFILTFLIAEPPNKWLVFHYVMAALVFPILWVVYVAVYFRDIKFMAWPDQLKIDAGWISFSVSFSSCFYFYLFYKMKTYGTLEELGGTCRFSCDTDLAFLRWSPLIISLVNLSLWSIQLYLLVQVYRNPIVNPPLDEHGMPKPINPLTGQLLPLVSKGQPILPPELCPPPTSSNDKKSSDGKDQMDKTKEKDGDDSDGFSTAATLSGSDDSDQEEKTLLNEDGVIPSRTKSVSSEKELGRRSRRKASSRRSR